MKKFVLLAAAAVGALLVRSKLQQDAAEQKLWAEATSSDAGSAAH